MHITIVLHNERQSKTNQDSVYNISISFDGELFRNMTTVHDLQLKNCKKYAVICLQTFSCIYVCIYISV